MLFVLVFEIEHYAEAAGFGISGYDFTADEVSNIFGADGVVVHIKRNIGNNIVNCTVIAASGKFTAVACQNQALFTVCVFRSIAV